MDNFPIVDANLFFPEEGKDGKIAVCSNTTSQFQVINEVEEQLRKDICMIGSLIVNRDGTERLVINALSYPSLQYIILFGEESSSFKPSTNLLQALIYDYDKDKKGNFIKNGVGAAHNYPSISKVLLEVFRKKIRVIPIYQHNEKQEIIENYMQWLKTKIPENIYNIAKKIQNNKKIYYDSLNELIREIRSSPDLEKIEIKLDPKEFQNLQPPKIILEGEEEKFDVNFNVSKEKSLIRIDFEMNNKSYFIKGNNSFLIAYSIMKFIDKNKNNFSNLNQFLLGAEMSRIEMEIAEELSTQSFIKENNIKGEEEIQIEARTYLNPDKDYYYKIGLADGKISVQCLAFDICKEVFDLRCSNFTPILKKLVELNRFMEYEQDFLHRVDVGIEIGRAFIANKLNYSFIQDFRSIFKINTEDLPYIFFEGDSFLSVHKGILTKLYTQGITEKHADNHKGLKREGIILAVYRNAEQALKIMPSIYKTGQHTTEAMREDYKKQLLRFDYDGSYSYGQRTRFFFGFDQLEKIKNNFDKDKAMVVQRFDCIRDMSLLEENGKLKATHDPCLTHDIYFVKNNKLNSFHIARAHNIVNAYPENVFGLHDAYTKCISEAIKIPLGDMFVLSNRGNILLLNEEQRTKTILAEPSNPVSDINSSSGPIELQSNPEENIVAYIYDNLKIVDNKPNNPILDKLENFEGVNLIEKAIDYLVRRGSNHNNPIISDFNVKKDENNYEGMPFFQANTNGSKINTTAVFINRSMKNLNNDIELCNYITTKYYKSISNLKLGKLLLFYVPCKK